MKNSLDIIVLLVYRNTKCKKSITGRHYYALEVGCLDYLEL